MARILVIGSGVGGLTAAMLLARDQHDVTVLERDAAPPPENLDEIWRAWERKGVNQFRQIHAFLPRFRALLDAELPDAAASMAEMGALRFNPFELIPAEVTGGYRDSDQQYEAITARRPVTEAALSRTATAMPNVEIKRGVAVAGFVTGTSAGGGVPHVVGVRTESGDEIMADLVIDASGRRSSLPALLEAIGAPAPEEEKEDSGFIYYGRHFRSPTGEIPPMMCGALAPWGSYSTLTLAADNGTWGLGIVTSARDATLRKLKDTDAWMRAWKSIPLVAHWIDGEAIDDGVSIMAKIEDRHRTFVLDGTPVATGVLPVGDAWACTNPSVGRGASIAFMHTCALRDLLREDPIDDPTALALRWHELTTERVEPWYRATLSFDQHRLAEIEANIDGKPYEPDDPSWEIGQALSSAAGKDPEVLRAMLKVAGVLKTPEELFAEPGLLEKVIELGSGWRDDPLLAPTREEIVDIVNA